MQSQNPDLRRLDDILRNKQATSALRKGLPLLVSLDISKGDERVFRESIVAAKQNLQRARGTVLTGYHGNEDVRETADDVSDLAQALLKDMDERQAELTKAKTGRARR